MGLIMQVLEETVTEIGGDDLWGQVTDETGVPEIYSRFDRYPGSDFLAVIEVVAKKLSVTIDEAMTLGGEKAFPHLFGRWPDGGANYHDAVSLIADLDEVIHAEVKRWSPESEPPGFDVTPDGDDYLVRYSSPRGLVSFCCGLLMGAFSHFGTPAKVVIESTEGDVTEFRVTLI